MTIEFIPEGVCSKYMSVSIEGGIITNVDSFGGCSGNLRALSALLPGMKAEDAVKKLEGIRCGARSTSCPDQLSKVLRKMIKAEKTADEWNFNALPLFGENSLDENEDRPGFRKDAR